MIKTLLERPQNLIEWVKTTIITVNNMKITESTLVSFPGTVGVVPGSIRFFDNLDQAWNVMNISPRSIKRAIKNHSCDRNGNQWYNAIELILDARGMVLSKIETQEWFDKVFQGIENLDEIR